MKVFFMRMAYYLLVFGLSFLALSVLLPPVISAITWPYTRHWNSWHEMFDTAIWILCRGLIVTPLAAFFLTLADYGKFRGWNDKRTALLVVLMGVTLVAAAEYAKLNGWWN